MSKRLGGIVWTARRRDGSPYLMVRRHVGGMLLIVRHDTGVAHTAFVKSRDVRRLMRLMQDALDWRYGKRKPRRRCKASAAKP